MLQVARVFSRTRTLFVCHGPCPSPQRRGLPVPGLQNHLCMIKEELHKPSLVRHFSFANACRNPPLRSLHRLQFTSIDNGWPSLKPSIKPLIREQAVCTWLTTQTDFRGVTHDGIILAVDFTRKRLGHILGLLLGTSYLSRRQGLANIANCESDPDNKWPYPNEIVGRSYQQSQVRRVVRRLWVPSICVLTISLGWRYPFSLLLNLLFLMWSTKPSPSSVYVWVEQARQQDALNTSALDRMKAQAAGVMHVEVRDNMLFCLARVTSLTKKSTLLGFMGDWWVIYSSSSAIHTGVKLRNLISTFARE